MTGRSTYGKEEKKVIKAHKKAFQEAHDTAGHDSVVQELILPDLLAFYTRTKHLHSTPVEGDVGIVKELKEWTSNNWRKTTTGNNTQDMKVNIGTIVKHMFWDRVNETLRGLVGVEELGQNPQQEFQLRNCAIKTVRGNLSPEEMVSVNAEKVRVAAFGNPPDKQRGYVGTLSLSGVFCSQDVSIADRYEQSRVKAEDKKRFMEMGMFSLSLVAWIDSTGQFKVQA
ncbi:hypothetical protein DXG01_003587 [Tephrocybe rancida]|nr:hypothetical protein DXG01_003587 [Tephrocybe rancida]